MENRLSKGKIAVIVIASVLVLSLLAFAVALPFMLRSGMNKAGISEIRYPDEDKYSAGNAKLENADFSVLDISWLKGEVSIKLYDGDAVLIEEEYADPSAKTEENRLRHAVIDGTLYIKPCRSMAISGKNNIKLYEVSKKLTVSVPFAAVQKIKEVDVDTVSAAVRMNRMDTEKISISTVSGSIRTNNLSASEFSLSNTSGSVSLTDSVFASASLENVSGRISLTGSYDNISVETVSGGIALVAEKIPEKISAESVSGDFELLIPDNDGFELSFDSVSGRLTSDDFVLTQSGSDYRYRESGSSEFSFDSVSADMKIIKK